MCSLIYQLATPGPCAGLVTSLNFFWIINYPRNLVLHPYPQTTRSCTFWFFWMNFMLSHNEISAKQPGNLTMAFCNFASHFFPCHFLFAFSFCIFLIIWARHCHAQASLILSRNGSNDCSIECVPQWIILQKSSLSPVQENWGHYGEEKEQPMQAPFNVFCSAYFSAPCRIPLGYCFFFSRVLVFIPQISILRLLIQ